VHDEPERHPSPDNPSRRTKNLLLPLPSSLLSLRTSHCRCCGLHPNFTLSDGPKLRPRGAFSTITSNKQPLMVAGVSSLSSPAKINTNASGGQDGPEKRQNAITKFIVLCLDTWFPPSRAGVSPLNVVERCRAEVLAIFWLHPSAVFVNCVCIFIGMLRVY
jgi:hypothetical protein